MCVRAHMCTCTYTYHIHTHRRGQREAEREKGVWGGYLPEITGDTGQKHTILCRYKLYIQDNKYKEVESRQMIAWILKRGMWGRGQGIWTEKWGTATDGYRASFLCSKQETVMHSSTNLLRTTRRKSLRWWRGLVWTLRTY